VPTGFESTGAGVTVWLLPCDGPPDERTAAACAACLDEDERARLASFKAPHRRTEYLLGHALARVALSAQAPEVAPARWRLRLGAGGRPVVAAPAATGLAFNLSHTRGLVAAAAARHCTVGLDVEWGGRMPRAMALAARYFSPAESAALAAVPPAGQPQRFLGYWTLKESYLKARGAGLGLPLRAIDFTFGDDTPEARMRAPAVLEAGGDIAVAFHPPITGEPAGWRFALWRTATGHVVALAVAAPRAAPVPLVVHAVDSAALVAALLEHADGPAR
jgi:4'-phosphopantetheinyl transferase